MLCQRRGLASRLPIEPGGRGHVIPKVTLFFPLLVCDTQRVNNSVFGTPLSSGWARPQVTS
jgi:hypothetical protein